MHYFFYYLKKTYKIISNFYCYKIFIFYFCYYIDNFFFSYFGPIYKNSWLSGQFIQGTPAYAINMKKNINIKDNMGDSLNNMELFLFFNKSSWSFIGELNNWLGGRFFVPKICFALLTPFAKTENNHSVYLKKNIRKKRMYSYHLLFLQKFLYIKFLILIFSLKIIFFFFFFKLNLAFIMKLFLLILLYIISLYIIKYLVLREYKYYKLGLYLFVFKNYETFSEFDFIPGPEFNKTEEYSIIKLHNEFKKDFNNRFTDNLKIKDNLNFQNSKNLANFLRFWHYMLNNIHNLKLMANLKKTKKNFFYLYKKSKYKDNNKMLTNFLLNPDKDSEDEHVLLEKNQVNLDQKFQSQKLINLFFDYFYRRLEKQLNQNNFFFFSLNLLLKNPVYYFTIHKSKQYLINLSYFFFKDKENKKFNLNFYIIFNIINAIYFSRNKHIKKLFFIENILITNSDTTHNLITNFFYGSNIFINKKTPFLLHGDISLCSYKKLLYYETNIGTLEKIYNNIIITQQYIIYLKYIKENPINIIRLNQQLKKQYSFLKDNNLKNKNINSLLFGNKILDEIMSQNILFRDLYFFYVYKNVHSKKITKVSGKEFEEVKDKEITLEMKLKNLNIKLIDE